MSEKLICPFCKSELSYQAGYLGGSHTVDPSAWCKCGFEYTPDHDKYFYCNPGETCADGIERALDKSRQMIKATLTRARA